MIEPVHISEVVKKVRKHFEKTYYDEHAAKIIDWHAVTGEELSGHSSCVAVKGTTLYVSVESSSYMFSMKLNKKSILETISKMYPDTQIKQIKFQLWRQENDKF